jgi:hypothetical protein
MTFLADLYPPVIGNIGTARDDGAPAHLVKRTVVTARSRSLNPVDEAAEAARTICVDSGHCAAAT